MAANGSMVTLSKVGGTPLIEIIFGHAQWAKFRIHLWDKTGKNPILIGEGVNSDQIPDVFQIQGAVADLAGKMVTWDCAIAPLGQSPGQSFSVVVRISQKGQVVPGGIVVDSGPLTHGTVWHDMVRLGVV